MNSNPAIKINQSVVQLTVENIKCGGCTKSINSSLEKMNLKEVVVSLEENMVKFKVPEDENLIEQAVDELRRMGYPLVNSVEGLRKLQLNAKSFISCAIGRMQ